MMPVDQRQQQTNREQGHPAQNDQQQRQALNIAFIHALQHNIDLFDTARGGKCGQGVRAGQITVTQPFQRTQLQRREITRLNTHATPSRLRSPKSARIFSPA